ncbi:DUF2975 domain-containing protein [Mycoplasmatota bacterium WC44]
MKRGTTLFLKIAVFLIGILIIALCIFVLPWIVNEAAESHQELVYFIYPVIIGMYVSAVLFFVALYQTLRLLSYIDKNKAFSELSVRALKNIKQCAFTISILSVLGMPLFYIIAEIDDAPGVILIGLIFIFGSFVVVAFVDVLQNLFKDAIDTIVDKDLKV